MIKVQFLIALCFVLSFKTYAQQKSEAFLVTVKHSGIHVVSPEKKEKRVSVVIVNNTSQNIISQLKTQQRVIERFNLRARSQHSIIVNTKDIDKLYYTPIAPAFQSVELKFNEKPYEIPEKN